MTGPGVSVEINLDVFSLEAELEAQALYRHSRAANAARGALERFKRVVRDVIEGLPSYGDRRLSSVQAESLSRRLNAGFKAMRTALKDSVDASVAETQDGLPPRIARPARALSRETFRPMTAVSRDVTQATEQDIRRFLKAATGSMPGNEAVLSIQRILNGQLPISLGPLNKAEATRASNLVRRAERVIVSETYNTARESAALELAALTPKGRQLVAEWRTRGDKLVCPMCIKLATDNVGYGKGFYLVTAWPKAPHPWCRCRQGAVKVLPLKQKRA